MPKSRSPKVSRKPTRKPVKRASQAVAAPSPRRCWRTSRAIPNAIGPASAWSAAAASRSGISRRIGRPATTWSHCATSTARAPKQRRNEFYPKAFVTDDYRRSAGSRRRRSGRHHDASARAAAAGRSGALRAGKHVLSQKPFVLDLDVGERLADLADKMGVKLAVNQNARWAPHFSYIREAARTGLLGTIDAVHCDVHWDHSWVEGGPFEDVDHLILYDFAIHWFDFLTTLMGHAQAAPRLRHASPRRHANHPPAAVGPGDDRIRIGAGLARLRRLHAIRPASTARSSSAAKARSAARARRVEIQTVELVTKKGTVRPKLKGCWFPDGFHGTMGELLCAIEEKREPSHSARNNLASLALCFAAVASAERGEPVVPGTVRRLPGQ